MTAGQTATILHVDLDAFYASVEQLLDPRLAGLPVAVGGGVVLAASYEARAYGVSSGMAGWRALQLCPGLRFVGGHFRDYQRLGDEVVGVLEEFTPLVERVSIDEAFLDVRGAVHLFGTPRDIAAQIRRRAREVTGLAVSVGVARTKHLAKIASQVAKPDGLVVVEPEHEREFLAPLPVELMWGVGPVTRSRLDSAGIHTIGELASSRTDLLERLLGQSLGTKLSFLASNVDSRSVETARRAASVGAQSAIGRHIATDDLVRRTLAYLADRVAGRLRAAKRCGRTVTVRVRFPGMRSVTRSLSFPFGISSTLTLTEVGFDLATVALADHPREREITLLAVSVSNLEDESALQLELPVDPTESVDSRPRPRRPGSRIGAARWSVDRAMDAVRNRFGRDAVSYAPVFFSDDGAVPEAFRELAERDLRVQSATGGKTSKSAAGSVHDRGGSEDYL